MRLRQTNDLYVRININIVMQQEKYISMAYEIKSNTKLGFDNSFVDVSRGIVSIDRFEGFQFIIENESITRICLGYNLNLDDDELIDIIAENFKDLDRKDRIVNFYENKPYIGECN